MARKKRSSLVQAMKLYEEMDERDRQTLSEWIRSQQQGKPRKPAVPHAGKRSPTKGAGLGEGVVNTIGAGIERVWE